MRFRAGPAGGRSSQSSPADGIITVRMEILRRFIGGGLVAAFLVLGIPVAYEQTGVSPRQEGCAVKAEAGCCCGIAGGCGDCSSEKPESVAREGLLLSVWTGCSGPAAEAAPAGGGVKFVFTARKAVFIGFVLQGWVTLFQELLPVSFSPTPESPPPKSA